MSEQPESVFCIICDSDHVFNSITEARQHMLAEHYEYCLAQCYGDKKLLIEWANLKENDLHFTSKVKS